MKLFEQKKTKLFNGKEVKEGDNIYFISTDKIRIEGKVERRKFNNIHEDSGKLLKKGTLFFHNSSFELIDYRNADIY